MPLIPQQDVVVVNGPFTATTLSAAYGEAVELLRAVLESYPPCRIVSITSHGGAHDYALTAVIETI